MVREDGSSACGRHLSPLLWCVALLTAILGGASAAQAQWFTPWTVLEEVDTPALGGRQLRQYAQILALTPEQKAAADELLAAYEREYRSIALRMKEISKTIDEEYDNDEEIDIWREVWPKIIKNLMKKTDKLDKGFMDDLKAILEPAQQATWPAVERLSRRQNSLRHGSRAGDQLDLVDIVDGLRLDPAAGQSVTPLVEQYALALDRELIARGKFTDDNIDRFFDVMMTWDEQKMKDLFGEMNKFSSKIVDLNRSYAQQIQAALPSDRQADFDHQVKLGMYPRVYKKTYATRVIDAAQALADLETSQRDALIEIRSAFERDAKGINDRWAAALSAQEADANVAAPWGFWGHDDPEAVVEARKQRKDLEKKTVDSVKAILNEDQRQKLPDRKWKPEFDLDAPLPAKPR